jgi:hypothetical protein
VCDRAGAGDVRVRVRGKGKAGTSASHRTETRESGEEGNTRVVTRKRHEQEFERGRVMFDGLLVLAQCECPLRVIERVLDSRRWILSGWLWTADKTP